MRIGIDIYPLSKKFQGISIYLFNLLKYTYFLDKENDYFLYTYPFQSLQLPFAPNEKWHLQMRKGYFRRSATSWMQFAANADLQNDNIDIFLGPQAILPLNLPPSIKTALIVNDLTFYFYPSTLKWKNRIIFPLFFKKSLLKASRVITISATVASEIKKIFPVVSDKITSLHSGIEHRDFTVEDKEQAKKHISEKFETSQKYILTVSTIEPRKNIENLLKAYQVFRKKYPSLNYQLLIAGAAGWNSSPLYKLYKSLGFSEKEVKFLGYVPQSELAKLYAGAQIFVFPSLYEGLGFPPLEALAAGVPVVASNIPVLKETLADCAYFFDPNNPEDIADSLNAILTDENIRNRLAISGSERIKSFSWERTAAELLDLFRQLK
ncbi:MAG: glycosyltransferase family 1 protein [Candidatus Omnitrophica bacterium]|nr:glycosyltransferase family 1 protein [Candidatus Omnitrophota bacterium]